jgi:hypothetical protein
VPKPYEKNPLAGAPQVQPDPAHRADVVVVGCSNCRDQIMKRIPKFYPEPGTR